MSGFSSKNGFLWNEVIGVTNRNKKVENMNSQEAYQYGIDKGFGRALGLCIGFVRNRNLDIERELKEFVLERKRGKRCLPE